MSFKIIEITPENIGTIGLFCATGNKYANGVIRKEQWYEQRYLEGLRIIVSVNQDGVNTGMIEYVPGQYAWRTINAKNYTVIHCLQISRLHTHQGYGNALLNACIEDSKSADGIAIVTSSKPWVNDKKFFKKQGFKQVDKAAPYYELLVKQLRDGSSLPSFNNGWESRALSYGKGITVFYSNQCPIIEDALKSIEEAANKCSMNMTFVEIDTPEKAQNAPFVYGTFGILLDGHFLTHRIFDKDRYINILRSGVVI